MVRRTFFFTGENKNNNFGLSAKIGRSGERKGAHPLGAGFGDLPRELCQ